MENNRKPYILGVILIILVIGGLVFWYYQTPQVNYLIQGVPYFGVYDAYLNYQNNAVTNTLMVLGYYGDDRFSTEELMKRFEESTDGIRDLNQVELFFKEAGYETALKYRIPAGGTWIDEVKNFVNPEKKVPVIVNQKRSPDPRWTARVYRLAIGVFDRDEKIVLHDYSFGNNYEMSYRDFESLFAPGGPGEFLAVWPSKALTPKLKGVDPSRSYPPRLPVMDRAGSVFTGPLGELRYVGETEETLLQTYEEKAKHIREEILANPDFESSFHPLVQIDIKTLLARMLIGVGRRTDTTNRIDYFDEAIRLVTTEVLPLNKDLDKSYFGWTMRSPLIKNGQVAFPLLHLARAYIFKEEFDLALDSLEQAWEIDSTNYVVSDILKITSYMGYENRYREILKEDPANERALKGLGRLEKAKLKSEDLAPLHN